MNKKVLSALLAVSVALNVSLVAGALYARHALRKLETAAGRAEWAARKLELDAAQREAFLRLQTEWRATLRQVRDEHGAEIGVFWAEALEDAPDRQVLQGRLEPLLHVQRQTTVRGVDHLLRLLETLTPPQRRKLVELIRRKEKAL